MFFAKLEFTILNSWALTTRWRKACVITLTANILAALVLISMVWATAGLVLRTALFSLSYFFIVYWVVSIFVYLYKKGQYGVYTRMIQRFWKRALWLFWLLELFLFFIFLYLALISPQEVGYMADLPNLVASHVFGLKSFFTTILYALIIILLMNVALILHKYNDISNAIFGVIFLLLLRAVFEDVTQFYTINNQYNGLTWSHVRAEGSAGTLGVWEQEVAELKIRTAHHYTYMLVFLKLWHTLFIVSVFIFLENASLRLNGRSFNSLAANLQNFYFLMFFNYILKISALKDYLSYLTVFAFYWFMLNHNVYDMTYVGFLIKPQYLLFLISDFF